MAFNADATAWFQARPLTPVSHIDSQSAVLRRHDGVGWVAGVVRSGLTHARPDDPAAPPLATRAVLRRLG